MTDTFVSWYFDLSSSSILYAATVWHGSCNYVDESMRTRTSTVTSIKTEDIRIELVDSKVGKVSSSELTELVWDYSKIHKVCAENDKILFDDTPEMKTVTKSLKKVRNIYSEIKLVKREGQISEQVMKYSAMINRDRFYIPDSVLIKPDLIFDESSLVNLIDPIYSDEQTSFPLTQSLLIACQYLESEYEDVYIGFATTNNAVDRLSDLGYPSGRRALNDFLGRY